ncbi:glycerophosphodiester phosphodiesterase family protein [Ciceribacter sp. L1K22]|uniref:glycerophosphodiester phosphodiesterase family protein n=1 Tax=Ciceribacter sp. L1K22 TaxID=2820275 RepID=UPI001ABEAE3A|nr:glycerophosphodiester phosphodiesterase family protein [Ciceribacter sp. L1K22]MBO3758465.1 glycerophosphodiester phosphodiesterase family protein [Ciceribacter sp. L1K22]
MRLTPPILALLLTLVPSLAGTTAPVLSEDGGIARMIAERLGDANGFRDHVMVVAHRAGWKIGDRPVRAENSRAAILHAAEIGVDMVELDVRRSSDGVLVVMHDATLDRTTTCQGEVARYSLAALRGCHLVVEGSQEVTAETVPTLAEMLAVARGRILVNIDNKLEPEDLPEIAQVARGLSMTDGVLLKMAVWDEERLRRAIAVRTRIGNGLAFMPIFADDAVNDPAFIERVNRHLLAPAAEMVVWHKNPAQAITPDGGALFSRQAQAVAIRTNAHLWINTYPITDRPEGMVAGGRGDGLAWRENRQDEVYRFWVERGATIIQTDEPEALIDWLEANALRRPYTLTN